MGNEIETNFNYRFKYFRNSIDMPDQAIDASLLSVDYSVEILKKSYIRRLDFVCASTNIITMLDYGLISGGLPNGVQFIRVDDAVETEMFNIQRWIEFGHFVDGQISQIKIMENPSENMMIASVTFDPIIPVEPGTVFLVRIRDDLSKLRYHRTSILLLEP